MCEIIEKKQYHMLILQSPGDKSHSSSELWVETSTKATLASTKLLLIPSDFRYLSLWDKV